MMLALLLLQASAKPTPWYNAVWETKNDPGLAVIQQLNNLPRIDGEPSGAECKKLLERRNDTPYKKCELLVALYRNREWYPGGDYPAEVTRSFQWANRKEIPASLACSIYLFSVIYGRSRDLPTVDIGERVRKLFPSNYLVAATRVGELFVWRKWPYDQVDKEAGRILLELTSRLPADSWQSISYETGWHKTCLFREGTRSRAQRLLSAYERLRSNPSTPASLRKESEYQVDLLRNAMHSFKP